jgi:hypothetical protein
MTKLLDVRYLGTDSMDEGSMRLTSSISVPWAGFSARCSQNVSSSRFSGVR